ncbi:hypothetical protein JN11_04344 [Mucilaginibacter frigoritolerans]|uniref:Uncharacterized protein n=1 Tax=Mucilaginibacter frigoritolerans TaxID=652788 RepID=A0A562TPX5_9SPHI|nr:hypothetical protein [Mucilaginibacter frigoritolerans]TWI95605.1 hypothetical protein JN11_04344 [Mucilaginibacter frigoritolerans]
MKPIKIIIIGIITLFAGTFLYFQYKYHTFVDDMVKSTTHIENYKLISKVHDDQQWYANILISKSDGAKLAKLYPFKYGNNPIYLAGKYRNTYIKNKPNCWYYFNDKGQGPYGYILYCLNNNQTQLEIYDLFAN